MTLREFLNIEIWSKQTTLRVLQGFAILVIGSAIFYLLEIFWISPPERSAGREALASIENLRRLSNVSDEQYPIADSEASQKVELSRRSIWTERDRSVNLLLRMYLGSIEHEAKYREVSLELSPLKDEHKQKTQIEYTKKLLDMERQSADQLGQTLHRVLD